MTTLRAMGVAALLLFSIFAGGWSFFDPFHAHIEAGNRLTKKAKAEEALSRYDAAAKVEPSSPIPDFNRALTLAKSGRAEEAKGAFQAAQAANDPLIASGAHYNLGNLLLEGKDTPGAIDQYLRSLDLNPFDPDAKRNLEIALRRREEEKRQEQQQQQQQQQKQQQEDSKQNQQQSSEDEKKDDEGNDEKSPEQQKQQAPEEEPKPDPSQSSPPDSSASGNETPPGDAPEPQEGQLSREDAARLLNAIESDELRVLRALEEKKETQQGAVADDW